MNLATTFCIDAAGVLLLSLAVRLVCRRQLSIGLGAVWIVGVSGIMLMVSVPPLYHVWAWMSSALTASPPGLIAVVLVLLGIVLHLSIAVSTLQRQTRELCQYVSLRDALARSPERTEGE